MKKKMSVTEFSSRAGKLLEYSCQGDEYVIYTGSGCIARVIVEYGGLEEVDRPCSRKPYQRLAGDDTQV